ncbi:YbgC/FadM family acyl-CoA thioesterase [Sphingomicrobium astaxanthinifaciens]|uniref:YbgC/FadM family acyl-CoA thioesterase n=1 Tax=Sphingomicrobium astaxanthinifaciens TaxID=1227949 RepID=UPI001FCC6318|nr:YbgC/FadM family acyl-CoA thioesterase [Sphingomicrobium astaxanthinifaciens]MCJ7420894.1 YbgC/FadM family acyl-CoA thioesterase [Sphingomicrobium astaxanthinifaciens]
MILTPPTGRFDGTLHSFPVRVYFEDTDLSGIVYHANYLRYFERARSDMLARVGIDQRGAHDEGFGAYAVTAMDIRWKRPAKLDDELVVESRVTKVRAASCSIQQRVRRADAILAEAQVTAALLTPEGRPRRQPADWVEKFKAVAEEGMNT